MQQKEDVSRERAAEDRNVRRAADRCAVDEKSGGDVRQPLHANRDQREEVERLLRKRRRVDEDERDVQEQKNENRVEVLASSAEHGRLIGSTPPFPEKVQRTTMLSRPSKRRTDPGAR